MLLSEEEIEKMDEAYLRSLSPEELAELAQRLVYSLMESRKQLSQEYSETAPTLLSADPRVMGLMAKVRRIREESGDI